MLVGVVRKEICGVMVGVLETTGCEHSTLSACKRRHIVYNYISWKIWLLYTGIWLNYHVKLAATESSSHRS